MTSTDFEAAPSAAIEDLTGDYTLDVAHTRIGFSARHAMVTTVRGSFGDFEGTAHLDATDPTKSSAKLSIKVASLSTGQEQRDAHLCSPDFFDVEAKPEITFTSTSAERVDDETYRLTGDLSIRHQTEPVTVEFAFPRLGEGPVRKPARRLRGQDDGQPQGLGAELECRTGDRRPAGQRQDQARVRRLGHQADPDGVAVLLTPTA